MTKKKRKGQKDKRDGGQFLALPLVVMGSPGYRAASHVARSLLLDIAIQYTGINNGRLVTCDKYLRPLGWTSNDTVVRARRELTALGLLVETRKGGFPNTATWYALNWQALDETEGLDINPRSYRTGGYMTAAAENAPLVTSGGARSAAIGPSGGTRPSIAAPSGGSMASPLTPAPIPSGGAYLETPSSPASG